MDAFIIAVKRKITVLNDQGRHAEVIPLAQRILDRIDHYEQHAKDYAEDSYRLSWSDKPADRDRYIDFSRAQANGFLAGAHAMTGDAIHACEYLARFDQSGYGHSFGARKMIIPTQMALGMYDEAMATCDEIVYRMGNDTVNDDYAVILRDRAIVARAKGHLVEAYNLMNRHANLAKVLSDSLHTGEAHDYAARYHAKEQELKIQEARDFLVRLTPKIGIPIDPVSEISVSLGITPETHSPEEVLNMVEVIAKRKNSRIVVCIDEFQQVGEFENTRQVQARLRSVWQHHHNTSYCLYGSKRHMMSGIFLNRSMPFYQFGDLLWLQKIPTTDWMDYVISHFEAAGKHVSPQMVEHICEAVDNYPSYVQHLSSILLSHLPQGGSVTDETMAIALSELMSTNEALYMQQVEPLSAYQMNLLKAIVSGIHSGFNEKRVRSMFNLGSPSNIVRLRDALIERDIIYSEMRQLYLTDPVFGLWFKKRFL